jgi:hypothetical protein
MIWLVLSVFASAFVVRQITSIAIPLNPIVITSGDSIEVSKTCKESCNVSGQLLNIDTSVASHQLSIFDNFFPLSLISAFNLQINYVLEGNTFLEVTYPKYSERLTGIDIFCGKENSPKYSYVKPSANFVHIKSYLVAQNVSQYFSCKDPNFNFSYNQTRKIEVGPNEHVKFTTQGKDVTVVIKDLIVTLTPDFITKCLVFLISFLLCLGAGSILYLYLCKSGVFRE